MADDIASLGQRDRGVAREPGAPDNVKREGKGPRCFVRDLQEKGRLDRTERRPRSRSRGHE